MNPDGSATVDEHDHNPHQVPAAARGMRNAREIEGHLGWLDTITPLALGVLAAALGVYTYLGVSDLLEGQGALTFFAAVAYSLAVSVGIFVFWSYVVRILLAMTHAGGIGSIPPGKSSRIATCLTIVSRSALG